MKELLGASVSVSVPPQAGFVRVIRSVAAGVAARLDFPVDTIDDVRIAVDEACARLLAFGTGRLLGARFTPSPTGLEALIWVEAEGAGWPPADAEGSLAWQVLTALSDEASFELADGNPAIRFLTRNGPHAGRDS